MQTAAEVSLSARELKTEDLHMVLSDFASVYSATDPAPLEDVPDVSCVVSSSISRLRYLENAIRLHQRKEALFVSYTQEAKFACCNIDHRLSNAITFHSTSRHSSALKFSQSSFKSGKKFVESPNEPFLISLFSNIFRQFDFLQSHIDLTSIQPLTPIDKYMELTHHNTRVQFTGSDDAELQTSDNANSVVANPASLSTAQDDLPIVQPTKPATPGVHVPTAPSTFFSRFCLLCLFLKYSSPSKFPGTHHFKYRKADTKKFKIPRMFEHLEWQKVAVSDSLSLTVGLYDKNGRRVRIARKKHQIQSANEPEDTSSDDSHGVPELDDVKVVSKRSLKVFLRFLLCDYSNINSLAKQEQARRFVQMNEVAQNHEAE